MGGTNVTGASAITYQPMNLGMASWTSSNGLVNTMGYDTDGRLTGISVPGVQSLGFIYDNADRITQIANGIDNTLTQDFGYDDESRLVSVYSGADNESFQYDADGNRIGQVINGTSTLETVSATSNQLTSFGTQSYGYDGRGNTTTVNGATTYQYDAFNRMSAAGGMAYYVNPEGQRLRKTGTAGTTYFAPDQGGSLLAENANGVWIDYVWLNGRLIGRMANNQAYAIHDDQLGRPQVVTDSGHNIVWQAQNLAFMQNVTTASITLNLGFPGQYYDAETSAWNNGFRDYNSGLGRYVESDPIGLAGGINTYAYVGNNPMTGIDPYGLATYYLAINGSATVLFGYQGALGIYLNPGWSTGQSFASGVLVNKGPAVGFNVGVGAIFGVAKGNACELNGKTIDVNGVVGKVQASVSFNPDGVASGAAGVAVGPPGGASVSYTNTSTFTWSQVGSLLLNDIKNVPVLY